MSEYNPFSLSGKKVLVTGASSGIGRGIAVACSKMGAEVFVTGRNEQRLDATLQQCEGETNVALKADLSDAGSIRHLVEQLPACDGIVHCAGVGQIVFCKSLTEIDFDSVIDTNLKGPILLQAELLRAKKVPKGGSIIFVSSIGADIPIVGNSVYSASKGGIVSYANCLALELAPRKIRVNCIQPGMVWTDLIYAGGMSDEDLREDEKRYPLKRYGQPEDVANLAIYLLSDASTWMTAACIPISGGRHKI